MTSKTSLEFYIRTKNRKIYLAKPDLEGCIVISIVFRLVILPSGKRIRPGTKFSDGQALNRLKVKIRH